MVSQNPSSEVDLHFSFSFQPQLTFKKGVLNGYVSKELERPLLDDY